MLYKSDYKYFVEFLLQAIEQDEDVRSAIGRIAGMHGGIAAADTDDSAAVREELAECRSALSERTRDYEKLQEDCGRLTDELEAERSQHATAKKQLAELLDINNRLATGYEQQSAAMAGLQSIQSAFAPQLRLYESYQNLPPEVLDTLRGIFRGSSVEEFVFCGVQKHNIELLWDTIKIRAVREEYAGLEELQQIFLYFFDAYNKTFEAPLYRLQEAAAGDEYDNEKHSKTSGSLATGRIREIVLPGYINTHNSRIERKTVVKL